MVVEITGGLISNSLAILTDAAHMLSDVGGFIISMISIKIGQNAPTAKHSFGYHRAEVIGALASVMIIWIMVVWLSWEATDRILNLDKMEIKGDIMLITAFVSLGCNIFNLVALGHMPLPCLKDQKNFMDSVTSIYQPHGGHSCGHDHGDGDDGHDHGEEKEHDHGHAKKTGDSEAHDHGHSHDHDHGHDHGHSHGGGGEENINIRAAVVHVIGDMLQSIGVIIAAVLITFYPAAKIADPICTYLFSILVLMTTIPVFRDCMKIVMEVQPNSVDTDKIRDKISHIAEVESIDDLHTWALAGSKHCMIVHVSLRPLDGDNQIVPEERAKNVHKQISKIAKANDI